MTVKQISARMLELNPLYYEIRPAELQADSLEYWRDLQADKRDPDPDPDQLHPEPAPSWS